MDLSRVPIAEALGSTVRTSARISGGSINETHRLELADGRSVFAKTHPDPPPGFFAAEADGLARLSATGTIRVPAVLAHADSFLALEWIEPSSSTDPERLGRQLARLHQSGTGQPDAQRFGLEVDNYIGALPQDNRPADSWPGFYATRRLLPLTRHNVERGRLPATALGAVDTLATRLDELCGPPEPPACLHGDLWGGNQLWTGDGEPVLVDPAVYAGHREVDLAMMRLFGGFAPATFAAYHEAFPLASGHADRVGLYQLYPLLVHVTLFGGGYSRSFLDQLAAYT